MSKQSRSQLILGLILILAGAWFLATKTVPSLADFAEEYFQWPYTLMWIGALILVIGMSRQQVLGLPLAEGSRLPDALFFLCGALIGGAGGALQSASRTMMVRHATAERATEAFGLYALSGKATAFLAPLLIATVTDVTGNQRLGISPLIVMFLLALVLLIWVKAKGEAEQ